MGSLGAILSVAALLMADVIVGHTVAALAPIHRRIMVIISFWVARDDVPSVKQTWQVAKAA